MIDPIVRVGAVAYDPRVVEIWEGLRDYFAQAGVPTDYVLFSNYPVQVDALFAGSIDIAWNTNLAYVRSVERSAGACRILAMRDTDLGYTTRLIARAGSGIDGWAALRGKRLAVGSRDSVQATVMPLHLVRAAGLDPGRDLEVTSYDADLGKHGDTARSEYDVLRALHDGLADAGTIGHSTWIQQVGSGAVDMNLVASVAISPPYNHCNFTALPAFDERLGERWTEALLAMSFDDPKWRRVMELEGLTRWVRPDHAGYDLVFKAVAEKPDA